MTPAANQVGDQAGGERLRAMAAEVLGPACAVGLVRIDEADPGDLFDIERRAVAVAVPARRQEFAAGRAAARQALGRALAIPMAADRSPVWPPGHAGSITHAGGWALAAAMPAPAGAAPLLGIDLELDADLPDEIWSTVLTPRELAWVHDQSRPGKAARLIFCIKECAYKAQFPASGEIYGFDVFETEVDLTGQRFQAVFQRDVAPFRAGDALSGRFAIGAGMVLAGIAL